MEQEVQKQGNSVWVSGAPTKVLNFDKMTTNLLFPLGGGLRFITVRSPIVFLYASTVGFQAGQFLVL